MKNIILFLLIILLLLIINNNTIETFYFKQTDCPEIKKVVKELKKTWDDIPFLYSIGSGTTIKKWENYLDQVNNNCYMDTISMPNCNDGGC